MQLKDSILITLFLLGILQNIGAQNLNWRSFNSNQHHLAYAQAGWDYGISFGLGYGYKFNTKIPLVANVEFSAPAGKNYLDDFKTKIGAQVELGHMGSFSATLKAYCPFRRYESSKVTMVNFGSEITGVLGYYRPKWFIAGEFGFDKAITTHINHSDDARANNNGLKDGWYIPTGGNYLYGIQTGISFRGNDLNLKAGQVVSQGFKTAPFIPWYAQLSFAHRF